LRARTQLDDRPPPTAAYETPFEEDPFAVPLESKIGDLLAADQAAAA
jgi:TldD protein